MSDDTAATRDLKAELTPQQYEVTQRGGTEQAFTGIYWDHHGDGVYACVVCRIELFDSGTKFESGSGWPSFWEPAEESRVTIRRDTSHGMVREEAVCANCDAHLGHRFPDGPEPTGLRYCINSASLAFADRDSGDGSGS